MNWFELLEQDVSWMTKGGDIILIKDMDHNHRRNAAAMLTRKAYQLALAYDFAYPLPDPDSCGDMAYQSLEAAQYARLENPERWISSTRLYQALVDGLNEGERVGALLGVPAS